MDLDGRRAQWITVAIGDAVSAGANLLALGDYAYAYQHSRIHFHAIRASELPETAQDARQLLGLLAREQRTISRRLAYAIIRRVMNRYEMLKPSIKRSHTHTELQCFIRALKPHLSPRAAHIADKTRQNIERATTLSGKILHQLQFVKRGREAKNDAIVLSAVIRHELSKNPSPSWRIDETGMQQIEADYFTLRDYKLGDHRSSLFDLCIAFGEDFLTRGQRAEYEKIKSKNKDRAERYLVKKTTRKIEPLWYYAVWLCRVLFEGENSLTPSDAYWLGIIDEVVGTNLTGQRAMHERKAKQPQPTSSPTAPSPQPSRSPSSASRTGTQLELPLPSDLPAAPGQQRPGSSAAPA